MIGLLLILWFFVLAAAETLCQRGTTAHAVDDQRLLTNFGFAALGMLASLFVPAFRLGAAATGYPTNGGLAHAVILPEAATFALTLAGFSLANYWSHRLMHRVPLLWRVHRVHHADHLVDLSSSLRNHPLELLVALPFSAAMVIVLGASVTIVAAVEMILLAAAIWQHVDLALPARVDRLLCRFVVTPRFHRLHHHPERAIHDNNYGDLVTVWDRLFGTFRDDAGRLPVGLTDEHPNSNRLLSQIAAPFRAG